MPYFGNSSALFLVQAGFKVNFDEEGVTALRLPKFGKGATGDSYYKENTSVYDNVESVTKRVTTLDKLIEHQSLPLPDVIKLDTQGSEIDIMEGAQKALDHATFVYIECSLVDYNKGAPQLTEIISYMKSRDFIPCDVCEEHRKSGALIQLDALWV